MGPNQPDWFGAAPAGRPVSRLWDIDVLIRRTLVYTAITGLLALAYFGSVVVLQDFVRLLTGKSQSPVVTVVSTLVIAALFVPLRGRVQSVIDRRFYRRKCDAARTLAAFSNSVHDEVELGRLAEQLTRLARFLSRALEAYYSCVHVIVAPAAPRL